MTQKIPHEISPVAISTAFGLDGRGIFPYTLWPAYRRLLRLVRETGTAVFTKSATRHARRGNFIPANPLTWGYIRRLPGLGMLNAYGLTNAGVEAGLPGLKNALGSGLNVIPNFYPEFGKGAAALRETLEAAALYRDALGPAFRVLELNFSCPNAPEDIACNVADGLACVREVRRAHPDLRLIAKLSVVHPFEFAQELEALGVHALHAVNTIPYDLVFPPPHPPSPLARVGGGGVSGGPAFAQAYAYNRELRKKVKLFLIMGCGVTCLDEAQRYFDAGADAVSLCTLVLRHPGEAGRIVSRYSPRITG